MQNNLKWKGSARPWHFLAKVYCVVVNIFVVVHSIEGVRSVPWTHTHNCIVYPYVFQHKYASIKNGIARTNGILKL
jgi:hypothetical protein